jgi:hypothetical protein
MKQKPFNDIYQTNMERFEEKIRNLQSKYDLNAWEAIQKYQEDTGIEEELIGNMINGLPNLKKDIYNATSMLNLVEKNDSKLPDYEE